MVLEAVPGLGAVDIGVMDGLYARDLARRLEVYSWHRKTHFAGIAGIGGSFHERRAARRAITGRLVDLAFVRYNAAHPGARRDLLPHTPRRSPTHVYNFNSTQGFVSPARLKALGLGLEYWQPAITDHYRFALSRSGIDGILCALNGPRQVETLALALDQGALNDEEERYLMDLARLDQGRTRLMNGVRGVLSPTAGASIFQLRLLT
jgi:hypothetical protein